MSAAADHDRLRQQDPAPPVPTGVASEPSRLDALWSATEREQSASARAREEVIARLQSELARLNADLVEVAQQRDRLKAQVMAAGPERNLQDTIVARHAGLRWICEASREHWLALERHAGSDIVVSQVLESISRTSCEADLAELLAAEGLPK